MEHDEGLTQGAGVIQHREVTVHADSVSLGSNLAMSKDARAIVLFAHGSGSSRHSPRNRFVADTLNAAGLATLLFDLLTAEEETIDVRTRELRFDIGLLADRLSGAVDWLGDQKDIRDLRVGLFGASTGAAGALMAAARRPGVVGAVVSRGGRPDLADEALPAVKAPTLLIVGGDDTVVIELNRQASARMLAEHHLAVVPGASHLFEEPGKLEAVAGLARDWFLRHLTPR
jgi:putative phosphoribosyl transferase